MSHRFTADVAVVIPCRDQARFLPIAIESALAQDDTVRLEIHVVDDGSRDETAEVARRYADRGVRCHTIAAGNANLARLAGVARSTAPLVLFLDADNWLSPDYVRQCREALEKTAMNSGWTAGYAYGDRIEHCEKSSADQVRASKVVSDDGRRVAVQDFNAALLLTGNYIDMCALIRRPYIRLDPALAWYQDWDQWLTLRSERIGGVHVPDTAFHYRTHTGSRTSVRLETDDTELAKLVRKHGPLGAAMARLVTVVVIGRTQAEVDTAVMRLQEQDYPQVEFCVSTKPGYAAAYQDAMSKATGEVVVFTETDVTPFSKSWLRQLVAEVQPNEVVQGLTITDMTPNMANTACEIDVVRRFQRNPDFDAAEDTEWFLRMQAGGVPLRQVHAAPVRHVRPFIRNSYLHRAYRYGRDWIRLTRQYGYAQPAEIVERSRVEADIAREILRGVRDEMTDGGAVPGMAPPRSRPWPERLRRAVRGFVDGWRGL